MPRRAIFQFPGATLHLIQRGNNRSACFYADEDYLFYLDYLTEQARLHGCAIHAYCLRPIMSICWLRQRTRAQWGG